MDQSEKEFIREREKLIFEWMRSNESFKALARRYGKGGKAAAFAAEADAEPEPAGPARVAGPFNDLALSHGSLPAPKPPGC